MQTVKLKLDYDTTIIKGIYILFIVMGHNVITQKITPEISKFLYDFHVFGFFLLPFLLPSKIVNKANVVTFAIRYLVPYTIFCIIFMITFNLFENNSKNTSITLLITAIFFGSAQLLKESTGVQLLWFLPSLFTLITIRMTYEKYQWHIKIILFLLMVLLHLTIGLLPKNIVEYLPLGLGPALFVLALGIAVEQLNKISFFKKKSITILAAFTWALLYYIAYHENSSLNLGTMRLPSILNIRTLIIHDGIILSSFIFITSISSLLHKNRILNLTGQNSMMIYLTHTPIFYLLHYNLQGIKANIIDITYLTPALEVIITYLLTLILALNISLLIDRHELIKKFLLPRNKNDLFLIR